MKVDLHIHTYYSRDSLSRPKDIIEMALERGIQGLAITDHHEIKGAIEALKIAFDKNILIIPGLEVKSQEGDILALGITKKIPQGRPALETIRLIKKIGGLAILPHPFSWTNPFKFKKIDLTELINLIDAIEVLNAAIFRTANQKALFFSQKYSLPFTAGSDAHHPSFVGRSYLELIKEVKSEKEVFEEIKKKNTCLGGREINLLEMVKDKTFKTVKIIKSFLYARRK
ncbi:MAG: PHP domain-containing protein [Patescibacteria group bacterium]|nr:PHP domain-containing protein [Patescibacteria group bacterium]